MLYRQRETNNVILTNAMAMGMTDQTYASSGRAFSRTPDTTGSLIFPLNLPTRNLLYMIPTNASHTCMGSSVTDSVPQPDPPQYVSSNFQPNNSNDFYAEIPGEHLTANDNQSQEDEYVDVTETQVQTPPGENDNKTVDKAIEKPDTLLLSKK